MTYFANLPDERDLDEMSDLAEEENNHTQEQTKPDSVSEHSDQTGHWDRSNYPIPPLEPKLEKTAPDKLN